MTDRQIMAMFSEKIVCIEDKAKEIVLRRILFGTKNNIDWQDAYRMALHDMPELIHYEIPEHLKEVRN